MDLDELKRILELMEEHDLSEVELEDPDRGTRIRLKKAQSDEGVRPVAFSLPQVAPAPAAAAAPEPKSDPETPDRTNLVEVPSPMVGTFYRAASPEAEPFVEVGDSIDEETVVCIIEAMKVMNEIKAEVSGEVVEILARNGEAVEYGQPLLLVRTE